ncbi:hypothetical protein, partial [Zavarzinella formosa]|uniref:hypothetical protein n=1 Tax=Zavarzinella formosa TaxID=360055 RepID=UPI00187DC2B0
MIPVSPITVTDETAHGGALPYGVCLGGDAATQYPDFKVDGGRSQTKVLAKSLLLGDPGDTPELALLIVDG